MYCNISDYYSAKYNQIVFDVEICKKFKAINDNIYNKYMHFELIVAQLYLIRAIALGG